MAATQYDSPIPTGVRLTHFDPEFRKNPYPIFAELRQRDPIHRDTELGRWVFTRHDDVWEILRNPEYWSDPRKGNPDSFARRFLGSGDEEPSMLLMDNPGHRRLRELARHPFTPRAVEVWRERARTVAKRHVSAIEEDEFDVISAVANPIPTVVIAELLGVDPERHGDFKRWSDAVIKTAFSPVSSKEDTESTDEARERLFSFFLEEIEKRRRAPADDLITKMVQAEESGDHLTNEEISLQCNLLLLAGNLTTSDLIGNAVMALVSNPDQQERLRADQSLMKNAVEEVLRFDSPVLGSGRIAHQDIEIGGVKISEGDSMSTIVSAANRDPAAYPNPDRFDVTREDVHHQSFGGGRHFCLGAHLARLEAAETLHALLDRFPVLTPGSGGHEYASNAGFRGLSHLSIRGVR